MNRFSVPDMSCGHCTAAIEKAIKAIDPTADVVCQLDTHTVAIKSALSNSALSDAIRGAGFEATQLPAA